MRNVPALLALGTLLSGCAGYAIDYTKPKTSLLGSELTRYGLDARQSQCVGDRLASSLSVWQLRQLQIVASSVKQGYANPPRLTAPDLIWAAKHTKSPKVGVEVARVAGECGLSTRAVAAQPPVLRQMPGATASSATGTVASSPAAAAAWINLGAAQTGQAIAVDASSLNEAGNFRSGWFRLTNPGQSRSAASYLLRVDCTARTINSMAVKKFGPSGAETENRNFGPGGEGVTAIESGTVMEIAYLALCT